MTKTKHQPVQLVQRLPPALLTTVAAVHLVLVWASSRQAMEHLPQRRHLPPGSAIAAVHGEGAAAFWRRRWEETPVTVFTEHVQQGFRSPVQRVEHTHVSAHQSQTDTSKSHIQFITHLSPGAPANQVSVLPLLSGCSWTSVNPTDSSRDQAKYGTALL